MPIPRRPHGRVLGAMGDDDLDEAFITIFAEGLHVTRKKWKIHGLDKALENVPAEQRAGLAAESLRARV